ncbi:unnamed protein product [Brassica oleracea var. botrytis]|uniref:PCI domain-containing protein n=1 Tax=Brassica oleracea TaxID=3712 RepID=A0A3P6DZI1_BRAOL|nr:unnamed protein product [Brassica oleracea]
MDPQLTEVSQQLERFKAAFVRKDYNTCSDLLSRLKVLLTKFTSLPPLFKNTPNAAQELAIARDIYEHAVVLSVKTEDQDAFERDFFQLKPYYVDARNRLPPSPQENLILGLNLLRLLVQNRIAEFHTELELLSSATLENPCIKHAVELEQSFMEGAYNRVLSARQTAPDATYVYFMDLLAKTIRDEIAGCSEKAYDYVSISDARQMLLFSSDQELLTYVNEEHPEWEVKDGFVVFQKAKETAPCKEIPSLQLINQTLSYARELERIV